MRRAARKNHNVMMSKKSKLGVVDLENIPGGYGTVEFARLQLIRQALEEDDPDILIPGNKIKAMRPKPEHVEGA
jgi:hypothetical protein